MSSANLRSVTDNLREFPLPEPAGPRPRRSPAQMEEIVNRLVCVPRAALEHALAAACAGLAEIERTGDDREGYRTYYAGVKAYLDSGGPSQHLRDLKAPRVGGAFAHGAAAVRQMMYDLGWTNE